MTDTDTRPADPRMQVIIDMIPADAPLFRVTHGNPLYWRPNSSGYVSEYNPFWAGLYPHSTHYAGKSDHSREVEAVDALRGISVPDGCLMAMLVDALTQTRAELAKVKQQRDDAWAIINANEDVL